MRRVQPAIVPGLVFRSFNMMSRGAFGPYVSAEQSEIVMSTIELERTVAALTDQEARQLKQLLDQRIFGSDLNAKPLAQGESLFDRVKHLAGSIDGPPDLSTNKAYMEGFGED